VGKIDSFFVKFNKSIHTLKEQLQQFSGFYFCKLFIPISTAGIKTSMFVDRYCDFL